MAILVTGGAGFIGSHLAFELIRRGFDVVVFDDLSSGFRWLVPPECSFVCGSLDDVNLLNRTMKEFKVKAVFHFAAKLTVPESILNPLAYYRNNVIGSEILIECALANGIEFFIFSSTAAVYGDSTVGVVAETSELRPLSPYGRSKLAVEWILKDVAEAHNLKFIIFRYFNVAGADPVCRRGQADPNATHLIKAAVKAVLGIQSELSVFGTDYPTPDGTCIRDYIHVSDLAEAHVLGLEYLMRGGKSDVFNCGYGRGFSVLDVINSIRSVSGKNLSVNFSERRYGDPISLVADTKAIQDVLGWKPKYDSIDTILEDSLRWERHLLTLSRR